MQKQVLQLSTLIDAPKETIWSVLIGDDTYPQWTSVFDPNSRAETDWQEGSKVLFKGSGGNGLVSRIVVHRPNEIISFEHQGMLKDGVEDLDSPEVNDWKGFRETYRLFSRGDQQELIIEQDMTEKEAEQFGVMWEKALQKVKELAEARA